MAVLGKIRQRSFFLIVIIALALFSFVLADVLQNGVFGSNAKNIGVVNGTDIDAQQFMRKVAFLEKQNQNTSNTQAMNSIWEQEVRSVLLEGEIEKLGLGLGNDQVINEIKKNPYFSQNPQFLNEAGIFDENKFKEFVKAIKNDPNKERWAEWQNFENEVIKSSVQQMYFDMVKAGVYTTKAEGQFKYVTENRKVDFDYVTVPYNTINDDQVKVTDDEILAFMKKSPKKYKSEDTRGVEYVFFENKASEADEKAIQKAMDNVLYGSIQYNDKTKANDSVVPFKSVPSSQVVDFINKNSDIKFDSTYVAKKELPLEHQEQLFALEAGEVYGPYVNNGHQCVSRVLDRKGNASVKASHILISFAGAPQSQATRTKEEAQTLANELLAKAKANPSGFAALAMENSEDPGSKNNGGEYDNIMPGQMVPEFNDFIFNNGVGTIGLVETTYGFHVIKVNEKYNSVLLGTVARSIEPSETTIDAIYTKASKFEADANGKDFAEAAKAIEATVVPANNLRTMDEYVVGLGAQREIVRWAYNASKGDVKRFDLPNGYAVVKLASINDTGLLSLDMARTQVGSILKNEKKAVLVRAKMKGNTLDAVAKATGGSVISADGVALGTPAVPNVGYEPKVVGTAFNLAAGKTSALIDGMTGVFMVKSKKVTPEAKATSFAGNVEKENQQNQNAAQMRAYQALKEAADIEDNRAKM